MYRVKAGAIDVTRQSAGVGEQTLVGNLQSVMQALDHAQAQASLAVEHFGHPATRPNEAPSARPLARGAGDTRGVQVAAFGSQRGILHGGLSVYAALFFVAQYGLEHFQPPCRCLSGGRTTRTNMFVGWRPRVLARVCLGRRACQPFRPTHARYWRCSNCRKTILHSLCAARWPTT